MRTFENPKRLRELLQARSTTKKKEEPIVVVDDPASALTKADLQGVRVLRSVEMAAYKPIEGENTILLRELDTEAASLLARRILPKGSATVPNRGLGLVPGVIRHIAAHSGFDLQQAEQWLDGENRMSQRFAQLTEEGKRLGSLLAAVGGYSQLNTKGDHVEMAYGMSGDVLSRRIRNALDSGVIVNGPGGYYLAPDFRLLREKWFPRYAEENAAVLKDMFRVAMTLTRREPVRDSEAEFATRVLLMAVDMKQLGYAMDLFTVLIPLVLESRSLGAAADHCEIAQRSVGDGRCRSPRHHREDPHRAEPIPTGPEDAPRPGTPPERAPRRRVVRTEPDCVAHGPGGLPDEPRYGG